MPWRIAAGSARRVPLKHGTSRLSDEDRTSTIPRVATCARIRGMATSVSTTLMMARVRPNATCGSVASRGKFLAVLP